MPWSSHSVNAIKELAWKFQTDGRVGTSRASCLWRGEPSTFLLSANGCAAASVAPDSSGILEAAKEGPRNGTRRWTSLFSGVIWDRFSPKTAMQNLGRIELVPLLHEALPFEQLRGLGQGTCLLKFLFVWLGFLFVSLFFVFPENYFISACIKVVRYNCWKKRRTVLMKTVV